MFRPRQDVRFGRKDELVEKLLLRLILNRLAIPCARGKIVSTVIRQRGYWGLPQDLSKQTYCHLRVFTISPSIDEVGCRDS